MKEIHRHLRAILFALLGYTFWVGADSSLKLLAATAIPKYETLMLINTGSIITVLIIALLRGRRAALRPRKPGLCFVLGMLQLLNMILFLGALSRLPLTTTYIIIFTGPMMAAIMAAIFLRERVGLAKAVMIAAGFFGVVVALQPARLLAGQVDQLGCLLVFAGVFFYTIYMLLLRHYGEAETPESAVLYPRLIVALITLCACIFWRYEPATLPELAVILGGGVFAGIGWMLVTIASQQAPAATVASYRYSQIISGAVAGYLIWHEVPDINFAIGGIIIILSGLYIAHHTTKGANIVPKSA